MMEMAKFFRWKAPDLERAFADLGMPFYDLQTSGAVHPVFRPTGRRHSGRKPDRADVWQERAHLVCALDLILKHSRKNREEAAEYVVKKLPAVKSLCRSGASAESSLLSWLDALYEGRVESPTATGVWQGHREFLRTHDGIRRKTCCELRTLYFPIGARLSSRTDCS